MQSRCGTMRSRGSAGRTAGTDSGASERLRGLDWLRALVFFQLVTLIWIFFRTPTLESAWSYLIAILTGDYTQAWPILQLAIVAGCGLLHVGERSARAHVAGWLEAAGHKRWAAPAEGFALGVLAAAAFLASRGQEFIYFQF